MGKYMLQKAMTIIKNKDMPNTQSQRNFNSHFTKIWVNFEHEHYRVGKSDRPGSRFKKT